MLLYQDEGDLRLKFGKLQFAVHVKITPYGKRVVCCRILLHNSNDGVLCMPLTLGYIEERRRGIESRVLICIE